MATKYSLPTEFSIMDQLWTNVVTNLHSMMIARVTAVYPEIRQVDVQPINRMPDGSDYAQILKVPFVVLRGGEAFISLPVETGNMCLLIFCDHCIDNSIKSTETSIAAHNHFHNINDAIAIIGLFPLDNMVQMDTEKIVISSPKGINISSPITSSNGSIVSNELHAQNGYSGSFATYPSKTVTVVDGIVTNVS